MRKVEEIERRIEELSHSEFEELREWMLQRDAEAWDKQIEQDASAGKLDDLLKQAREDFDAGRARKL